MFIPEGKFMGPIKAAAVISEIAGRDISPDQVQHWMGSGHFRSLQVAASTGSCRVVDYEVAEKAVLWANGGKGYLPLYRGGQTFYSSRLVGAALSIGPPQVNKLARLGKLEPEPVGNRNYYSEKSLDRLLALEPWRSPSGVPPSDIIKKLYGGP